MKHTSLSIIVFQKWLFLNHQTGSLASFSPRFMPSISLPRKTLHVIICQNVSNVSVSVKNFNLFLKVVFFPSFLSNCRMLLNCFLLAASINTHESALLAPFARRLFILFIQVWTFGSFWNWIFSGNTWHKKVIYLQHSLTLVCSMSSSFPWLVKYLHLLLSLPPHSEIQRGNPPVDLKLLFTLVFCLGCKDGRQLTHIFFSICPSERQRLHEGNAS